MRFGKNKIDALLKDRKLTQEQLAEKVEITVQYLGTIERKSQYHIK